MTRSIISESNFWKKIRWWQVIHEPWSLWKRLEQWSSVTVWTICFERQGILRGGL